MSDLGSGKKADIKKEMRITDWLLALFTGLLVVVSALQWLEIRSGSVDTHALAEATKKQAEALSINSKTTYESFIASSRAWISLRSPIMKYPKLGDNIELYQEYGNVGHSPSLVALGSYGRMYDNGEYNRDFLDDVEKAKTACLNRTIEISNILGVRFPGNDQSYYYHFGEVKNQDDIITADDDFITGRTTFVFHECYVYKVGSETKHTYMCSQYQIPKTKPTSDPPKINSEKPSPDTKTEAAKSDQNTQDIGLEDCPQGSFAD